MIYYSWSKPPLQGYRLTNHKVHQNTVTTLTSRKNFCWWYHRQINKTTSLLELKPMSLKERMRWVQNKLMILLWEFFQKLLRWIGFHKKSLLLNLLLQLILKSKTKTKPLIHKDQNLLLIIYNPDAIRWTYDNGWLLIAFCCHPSRQ